MLGGKEAAGQVVPAAELFNPGPGTFSAAGELGLLARAGHVALVLSDGQFLVAGGVDSRGELLSEAELYNLASG